MRLEALKDEIDTDPLTRGYSGMTDQQVADDIMAKTRPDPNVLKREIFFQLLKQDTYAPIKDDSLDSAAANHRLCLTVVSLLEIGSLEDPIDIEDASVTGALGGLVALGYLTAAQRTEIEDLKNNKKNRAQELELGNVRVGTVAQARAL